MKNKMIQKLVLLSMMLCCQIGVWAQQPDGKPRISKEEFRAKQEQYMAEKAGLNKEEREKFFPVYFELQDKIKEIHHKAWEGKEKKKRSELTEEDYSNMLDRIVSTRIEADKLEAQYMTTFKQLISAKKVLLIKEAEMSFHRNMMRIMHGGNPDKGHKHVNRPGSR